MNSLVASGERRVRHGLIEDWRDALGILLLLLVAAVLGALVPRFVWPSTDDLSPANELLDRVSVLETRLAREPAELARLRDRVAKLEAQTRLLAAARPAAAPDSNAPPAANADLATRIAALETKFASVPQDVDTTKKTLELLSAETASVKDRLATVESSDVLEHGRRAALAAAVANLMRAAQGSAPFLAEYNAVASMAPQDARLAAIRPAAAAGLPSTGTLITSFGGAADAALDAENAARGRDWTQRLWAHFTALVSIRTVGETPGATTEARLARAEVRLKGGDLAAAVKELGAISGPARAPLSPWLAQARARVKLEAAVAAINTSAIAAITAPRDAGAVPQLPPP